MPDQYDTGRALARTGLNRALCPVSVTGHPFHSLSNMPHGGQVLYVRLWSLLSNGWQYNDYYYFAAP